MQKRRNVEMKKFRKKEKEEKSVKKIYRNVLIKKLENQKSRNV